MSQNQELAASAIDPMKLTKIKGNQQGCILRLQLLLL
jgi:hypothetical protein